MKNQKPNPGSDEAVKAGCTDGRLIELANSLLAIPVSGEQAYKRFEEESDDYAEKAKWRNSAVACKVVAMRMRKMIHGAGLLAEHDPADERAGGT